MKRDSLQVQRKGVIDGYTEHLDNNGDVKGRTSSVDGAIGKYQEHRDKNGQLVGISTKEEITGIEIHRDLNGTIKGTTYNDGLNEVTRTSTGNLHSLSYGSGGAAIAENEQLRGKDLISLVKREEKAEEKLTIDTITNETKIEFGIDKNSKDYNMASFLNDALGDSMKKDNSGFGEIKNFMGVDGSTQMKTSGKNDFLTTGIFGSGTKQRKKTFLDGGIFG